jgi:hypothetical protein
MSAEAAVAMEGRTVGSGRKRAKLVASRSSPLGANPFASPKVVKSLKATMMSHLNRLLEGNS